MWLRGGSSRERTQLTSLRSDAKEATLNAQRIAELIGETVEPILPRHESESSDRRTKKRVQTKRTILQVAWHLFMTVGYEDTTIQDITDAADVGKGTFFTHFRNKSDVALHLCQHRRDVVIGLYRQGAFGTGTAGSRIVRLLGTLAGYNAESNPEARTMTAIVLRQFFAQSLIMGPGDPDIERVLGAILQEGILANEVDPSIDVAEAARLLYGAFYSTKAAWLRPGAYEVPFPLREGVESATRIVLRGLGTTGT